MPTKLCLERTQIEDAVMEAKSGLEEVRSVSQYQQADDIFIHLEQLNALSKQLLVYEKELEQHLLGCDCCTEVITH